MGIPNKLKSEFIYASTAFLKLFLGLVVIGGLIHWDIRFATAALSIALIVQFIFRHKTKGFEKRSHFYIYLFNCIIFVLITTLFFTVKQDRKNWGVPFLPFFSDVGVVEVLENKED